MPAGTLGRLISRAGLLITAALLVTAAGCDLGSGAAGGQSVAGPSTTTTTDAPTTTTTEPPTTTTTAPPPTTTPAPEVPPPTTEPAPEPEPEVLGPGADGPRTLALQQRLSELRFDPGTHDGVYGTKTQQAVWAFQHTYGFEADGLVGPELWAAIQSATAPEPLVPDGGPNRTEISLGRQVLYVYRDGQLALITHISSGTGERYCDNGVCGTAVTPTGSFTYERRISGWRDAPLGLLYNPVYFYKGWAVHGSNSVPNHPASHGCVRIPMHIAEYFPGLVNNGDPVYVL